MDTRERIKAYVTIVLSMILGLVCFALAGLFMSAAVAQELTIQPAQVQVSFQQSLETMKLDY
jgi:hypothetical protein